MNKPQLKGNWNEMKGKVKAKWGELTDDEIDRTQGERQQLVGLIQQRYGKAREEAEKELDEWEEAHGLR